MRARHDQVTTRFSRDSKNLRDRVAFFQPTFGANLLVRNCHPVQFVHQVFPKTPLLGG
jgi:hypothetical protein